MEQNFDDFIAEYLEREGPVGFLLMIEPIREPNNTEGKPFLFTFMSKMC